MTLYFDTAYVAKCYLNEPDGRKVRQLAGTADGLSSSFWCLTEFSCVLHRHLREGSLGPTQCRSVWKMFQQDIRDDVWNLLPLPGRILQIAAERIRTIPKNVFIRTGDAIHLATAQDAGFTNIWSNDRHLLAAATHFQLTGKSVE